MKSPMIENAEYIKEEEKGSYSELEVLHSSGGYYIGTIYHNPDGYDEPGSRDSQYFSTSEKAEEFLKALQEDSTEAKNQLRSHP